MTKKLGSIIEQTNSRIEQLKEEIDLDRRLGRTRAADKAATTDKPAGPDKTPATDEPAGAEKPKPSSTQLLLARQQQHLALLGRIGKDPAKYDLAGEVAAAREEIMDRMVRIQGAAAVALAEARAFRWQAEFDVRARARSFPVHVMAMEAAPSVYRTERELAVLAGAIASQAKYIVAMAKDQYEVWLNLEQKAQPFEEVLQPRENE